MDEQCRHTHEHKESYSMLQLHTNTRTVDLMFMIECQHSWRPCIVTWKGVGVVKIQSLSLTDCSVDSSSPDTTIGR